MFDGVYFQFPKLGFLLFFFLACEALCPLRSNPLYFPRTAMFGEVGVKSPIWLWIAKWGMIAFLIVALMSPVRDHKVLHHGNGWDILLIIDPALTSSNITNQITSFIDQRPDERIALWIPDNTIIPLTYDHKALKSILLQKDKGKATVKVDRQISRFFATSNEGRGLTVIFSEKPKTFVYALPIGIQTSVIAPISDPDWGQKLNRDYPPYFLQTAYRYFDYYYVFPLFLGFLSMLAYLFGRNQKGLK